MCSSNCPCGGPTLARRAFLGQGALGALGALGLAACGDRDIGGTYPTSPFPTEPFTVKLSDFPQLLAVGGTARINDEAGHPVALVRTSATAFQAISLVCPHQGATVELIGSGSFRCPSHLAEFAADGTWIGGRQTGDLTALGVTFDAKAGTVTINGPVAPGPPPSMLVSPSTEVFNATQGGANPAAQSVAITNTGGGTLSGLDVVVAYGSGATGWLSATLDTQTAPATLTLRPIVSSLAQGAYSATVQITAPTAINAPQSISVTLLVSAPAALPSIVATPSTAAFFATAGGANPTAQRIAISTSAGALSGLSVGTIAYGAGTTNWLAASLTATTTPATLVLTPTTGTLPAGTYSATVPIVASGASNSPLRISVTFTVSASTAPPSLALSATTAAFTVAQGGSSAPPQTITIQNGGGGTLGAIAIGAIAYGAGGSGWLTAVLSGTTAPTTLTLTAAPLSLAAGTYTATVPVTSAGVSNSPQNVVVTLTVAPASSLAVSPTTLGFTTTVGTNPGGQVVNITSSGAAQISGLAYSVAYSGSATGWLATSSLSATTTPAALTVRATANTLAAGTYTATIQISGTGASSKSVAVTLVVTQAGLAVVIANWPTLANVGGIAGSVGLVQGTPTAVVRTGQSTFAAFSMRCPHQGTTIRIENWHNTGSAFHCPNHDALFDSAGQLLPSSPQRTTNLVVRTVRYTAGDTTLYIT